MSEKLIDEAKNIMQKYKDQLQYKKQMGFMDKWPEYERFKAGDQWPAATDKTRNLPRPVFNIIDYIENHKVSSVANENIKMVFSTQEVVDAEQAEQDQMLAMAAEAADKFTRFSDTTWENIKQDELNEESLESGSNLGTGIWHYFLDTEKKGGLTTKYIGELDGETIDPMNIFFGNPQQTKVQKQPYIIISYRDLVANFKKEAEANKIPKELIELIKPDKETQDEGYDMAKHEVNDDSKATGFLMYWKEAAQIKKLDETGQEIVETKTCLHFSKCVSNVIIKPKTNTYRKLYPIEVIQWKRRKKSIFGIGDTEGIIPNQKAVNFLMAMQLLGVQLTGWPKLMYTAGGINPNLVTNTPGEMIEKQLGAEVSYLMPGNITPLAQGLVETFMEHTKSLSSAHDVATGNIGKGDMNASAIMLLQKSSGIPLESIKKRYYRAMEGIGRIWEDFWKVNYNTDRKITVQDDDGNDYSTDFNGSQYADIDLNLKIDIGPSSMYSEELMMSTLDKLYDKGDILAEDYIELAPKNVAPFKDRLLKKLQERAQEQAMMQQEQMQMQQQQMDAEANAPQDIDIQAALKQLSPDEQKAYQMATPEQKQQILQQLLQPAQ